ncbi:MAG: mechanosensitive ion channel [Gammaproteobacteria bacterium]|nr:mechanosensitive ion channel [Gammaproteobacteria bacterium]MCP5137492.1 mechanosensitive ion channel [Gammaproteobacteria bacterium]
MDISVAQIQEIAVTYGVQILLALVIFIVGKWVARMLVNAVKRGMGRAKVDETLIGFIGNITYAILMIFVVLAALNQVGVQTTSFIAILGAAGLAVGLALQSSLSNFASGVMMIIFRPFKVGDFIEAGGTAGVVEEINIFTTQLRTGDNKTMFVPNGSIMGGNITNVSAKPTRRVDMTFGIGYGDDIKKAKEVLADILAKDERVLKDPAPLVAVAELADSSVNFAVRPWVKSGDYWGVFFDTQEQVKLRFDAEGISIPFPQTDIHLIKDDAT